jgi:hypothetical protein
MMPLSMAHLAHLSALPDDLLRAMAAFMPPSGLLAMVRCSRRLSMIINREVSRRLDGLFVVAQPDPMSHLYLYKYGLNFTSESYHFLV